MKPKTHFTYQVYRQETPVLVGIDYRSSFTLLGVVSGSTDECWEQAKQMTEKPVLEVINVH